MRLRAEASTEQDAQGSVLRVPGGPGPDAHPAAAACARHAYALVAQLRLDPQLLDALAQPARAAALRQGEDATKCGVSRRAQLCRAHALPHTRGAVNSPPLRELEKQVVGSGSGRRRVTTGTRQVGLEAGRGLGVRRDPGPVHVLLHLDAEGDPVLALGGLRAILPDAPLLAWGSLQRR